MLNNHASIERQMARGKPPSAAESVHTTVGTPDKPQSGWGRSLVAAASPCDRAMAEDCPARQD
jgi:hypothetical protein